MKKKISLLALFLLGVSFPRFSKSKKIKEIQDKSVLKKMLKNRYKQNEAYARLMCLLKKKIIAGNSYLVSEMIQLPLDAYILGVDLDVVLKGFDAYEDVLQHLRDTEKHQSFLANFKHIEVFRKGILTEQERISEYLKSSDFGEEKPEVEEILIKNRLAINKFRREENFVLKAADELLEDMHHCDKKFLEGIIKNIPREFACHKWALIYLRLQEIKKEALPSYVYSEI